MAREAITQYNNPTPVSPDDCYALNVETRENGDYLVHVSQRPGKTCEIIDYGRPFQPFDIEVNAARGSAFVVGYPGVQAKPRDLAVFPLTDAPALHSPDPQDIRNWRLEGDATHLAYTKQCHLSLAEIPFEMRNGYFFGLTATTESRLLRVSYNVNSVYPVALKMTRGQISSSSKGTRRWHPTGRQSRQAYPTIVSSLRQRTMSTLKRI
ncbi:hypothetical protein [Paraburkholderia phenoliruptrix]|uniref:hypothetical protein n=1 Tax=Paraburkholderia phenoliruptrix TaxID=252970 RepID=UPI003D961ADE